MATRAELREAYVEVTTVLKAAESWQPSYKQSPDTFKALVREEAKLQASANDYLLGLKDRVPSLVNWPEVELHPIQADTAQPRDDDAFSAEEALLTAAIYQHLVEIMVLGGQAGEDIYDRPIGVTTLSDYIIDSAEKYTGKLVSGVTDTTRKLIQQAIKRSIAEGRDIDGTIDLIRTQVANPVRARMIASTESVNAYQIGLDRFAEQSGAVSSTWEALLGACQLCAPMDGVTVPIGEPFTLPDGVEVFRPPAHVSCRCGRIINYA